MSYYTNPRKDRKYYAPRRAYRQFRRNPMAKAEQALRIANATKRLLNVEKKHNDVAATQNPTSSSWLATLLNGVAQGDSNESRDGSSVKMLSLYIKGYVNINSSTSRSIVRLVVIHDKVPDGVAPNASEVFDANDVNAMYNTEYMGTKYTILCDKTYSVSDGGNNNRPFKIYKKLNNKIRFSGTGSAITDISQGALWLYVISDEATNTPTRS